jgi:hypothetical protein
MIRREKRDDSRTRPKRRKEEAHSFRLSGGASADMIAKALNEAREKILAEKAEREKKAAAEKPQSD